MNYVRVTSTWQIHVITFQRELEKQQRLGRLREMNRKADEHYHKTLLNNFGFQPWKKLIEVRDEMMNNAEMLYNRNLQSACFHEWLAYTKTECQRRNQLADTMYKTVLLRLGWQSWKKVKLCDVQRCKW